MFTATGEGEGYEYKSRHIFFIQDTLSQPLMKIFPTVFKIEGIVALIIKRRELRKYKGESCHSCTRHIVKTWFVITVKYYDNISKGHSSYGADMKFHLKPSRGNNSENMKARVVILVRDTLS